MKDFIIFVSIALPVFAWLTHLFFCFSHAAWGFLIAGAVFFPVGIIHGFYLWFT